MSDLIANTEADLGLLLAALACAKVDENEAKARRIELEDRVVAAMFPGGAPEKGSLTTAAGAFRCTAKFGLNYKANVEAIRGIDSDSLPLRFKSTYELDEAAYERLRVENPALFAKVAAFVETKPAKPSLTLKV